MSINQFVFPDVYVAVGILRRGSFHVIIENVVTKRSSKMAQVLIEHEGTYSFLMQD